MDSTTIKKKLMRLIKLITAYHDMNKMHLHDRQRDVLNSDLNSVKIWLHLAESYPHTIAWSGVMRDCNELWRLYK